MSRITTACRVVTAPAASAIAALLLCHAGTPEARGAAIRYESHGWIDDTPARPGSTITGDEVVRFEGVEGFIEDHAPFHLGDLVVVVEPGTPAGRYDQTPLRIEIRLPDLEQSLPAGAPGGHPDIRTVIDPSAILDGVLDGVVHADGSSEWSFEIRDIRPGSLRLFTADHVRRFTFPLPLESLVVDAVEARTTGSGVTRIALHAQVVPEPATLVVFAPILAGLLLRRRFRLS